MARREAWSYDRVCFHDDQGRLISLPASWTSVVAEDPFVALAAGRCALHIAALQALASLLERWRRQNAPA